MLSTLDISAHFEKYWPLESATIDLLKECIVKKVIKRKEFLLAEGQYCNHVNFVIKGVLKLFHTDDHGKLHTLQFASEGDWLTDYSSLYNNSLSQLSIQALEPSQVLQLKKEDVFRLYDNSPLFDRNMRISVENAFIEQQQRVLQNISSTAQEKYDYFLRKYPHLSNRISNVQIASYLGITPEFLSTLRKKRTASASFS